MIVTVKLHYRAGIERGKVHQRGLEGSIALEEVNQTTPPQFRAGALTGHYEARNADGRELWQRALQICSLLQRVIARGYDWFANKGLGMGQKKAQHNWTDHLKRTS